MKLQTKNVILNVAIHREEHKMLKFQKNYTIAQQSFEDFILVVFVLVDDLYKKVAPKSVKHRPNISKAILSDSEIITIALCGEIMGIDSENAWYAFVKKNYKHLFPKMCDRSQFNRTRRNLLQVMNLIFTQISETFQDEFLIVDSFPLEVCKFGRAKFCRTFRDEGATYSYNPSKKKTFFGYKVHAVTTSEGAVKLFEITPANIDDRKGLEDFSTVLPKNCTVIADKGYQSQNLEKSLADVSISLLALRRNNSLKNFSANFRQMIFKMRRRIETDFSQLSVQFNIERVLAKKFQGLCVRLLTKFLAFNLCIFIKQNLKIKSLIF